MADQVKDAPDVAKNALGGRNPLNMPSNELNKLSPDQTKDALNDAKEQGKQESRDSSLKIKIELDLDVEVHLTARIKGDITIGLL